MCIGRLWACWKFLSHYLQWFTWHDLRLINNKLPNHPKKEKWKRGKEKPNPTASYSTQTGPTFLKQSHRLPLSGGGGIMPRKAQPVPCSCRHHHPPKLYAMTFLSSVLDHTFSIQHFRIMLSVYLRKNASFCHKMNIFTVEKFLCVFFCVILCKRYPDQSLFRAWQLGLEEGRK